MKVLIISDFYYPHWTGISKSIHYLTQALKDEFEFTVLTVKYEKNLSDQEVVNDVTIVRKLFLFRISRAKYSVLLLVEMIKIVSRFDVVLINSPCSNIFPAAVISKLFGKKLLIFHQGDLVLPKGAINRIIQKIYDLMSYIGFLLADKVASYTDDYIKNSRLLPVFSRKSKVVLIPLPFFKNNAGPKFLKTNITKKLSIIKKEKLLIGFAGRFVEEKGFDILLKAISLLRRKRSDLHFVFAGATEIDYENFYEKNQSMIGELGHTLTFLGLLTDKELKEYYQVLDLFVIPSRGECFGLVQAEALSNQVPVVSSNVPGSREVIKRTKFGLLFESEDHQDLAKTIEKAISLKDQFSKNIHLVKSYFDYEKAKKQAREFFTS